MRSKKQGLLRKEFFKKDGFFASVWTDLKGKIRSHDATENGWKNREKRLSNADRVTTILKRERFYLYFVMYKKNSRYKPKSTFYLYRSV